MLGFSKDDSAAPRKRKRSNLEFNFITGTPAASARAHKNKSRAASAAPSPAPAISNKPREETPVEAVPVPSTLAPATPSPEEKPIMSNPTPNSTANPAPIRTSSIERQIKEQKSVSNVMNGMALALICGVLLVAALAATGGYVLWKQLQDQSVSLALLEQNTKDRMFDLKAELVANDADLAKSSEQASARLVELTTQFESYRSETAQLLTELKANNRSLERSLSLYQKKAQDQDMQLAQLRRNR